MARISSRTWRHHTSSIRRARRACRKWHGRHLATLAQAIIQGACCHRQTYFRDTSGIVAGAARISTRCKFCFQSIVEGKTVQLAQVDRRDRCQHPSPLLANAAARPSRPPSLIAPFPAFSGSENAALMLRADAISSALGENAALHGSICAGWISVLPSKPSALPCSASARNRSRSLKSLHTPSNAISPRERAAASASVRMGSIARPVWRWAGAHFEGQVVGAEHEPGEPASLPAQSAIA